ncbi:MAG TPA: hypothetical protein VI750_14140, partial [Pyrinomonadaceae bacterium]|nr:hypothetical protein [Pyrinomonadaceae bacterium]
GDVKRGGLADYFKKLPLTPQQRTAGLTVVQMFFKVHEFTTLQFIIKVETHPGTKILTSSHT